MRSWGKRSVQIAKGQFLEVAKLKSGSGFAAGLLPDVVRDDGAILAVGVHALCLPRTKSPGKREISFGIFTEEKSCL